MKASCIIISLSVAGPALALPSFRGPVEGAAVLDARSLYRNICQEVRTEAEKQCNGNGGDRRKCDQVGQDASRGCLVDRSKVPDMSAAPQCRDEAVQSVRDCFDLKNKKTSEDCYTKLFQAYASCVQNEAKKPEQGPEGSNTTETSPIHDNETEAEKDSCEDDTMAEKGSNSTIPAQDDKKEAEEDSCDDDLIGEKGSNSTLPAQDIETEAEEDSCDDDTMTALPGSNSTLPAQDDKMEAEEDSCDDDIIGEKGSNSTLPAQNSEPEEDSCDTPPSSSEGNNGTTVAGQDSQGSNSTGSAGQDDDCYAPFNEARKAYKDCKSKSCAKKNECQATVLAAADRFATCKTSKTPNLTGAVQEQCLPPAVESTKGCIQNWFKDVETNGEHDRLLASCLWAPLSEEFIKCAQIKTAFPG